MAVVYIGIGTNTGNRQRNIVEALKLLAKACRINKVSSLYETEPEGYEDQPYFLNCVIEVETDASAFKLLKSLKDIEKRLGREESFRNAPRPIDLDILFYGDQVITEPGLEVPHPRLVERAFVLVPLGEIAPDLVHPVLHKMVRDLLGELKSTKIVRKWGEIPAESARS
jgi:2-amino-4-hydroxy-6-hydroxymethyldihydropteridine diphosphokinase